MTAANHKKFVDMGKKIVSKHGREITLVKFSSDGLGTIIESKKTFAAFMNPATLERLGFRVSTPDFIATAQEVAIVASSDNLENFHGLIDSDTTTWKVASIDKLAPGPIPVLWFIGVKQ